MKKIIYLIFTLTIFLTSAGFRGCGDIIVEIVIELNYIAGRTLIIGNDNTIANYTIACGENGTILTNDGRPPNQWVPRNSGITQHLNGVKFLNSSDSAVAYAVGNGGTVLRTTDNGHNWQNIRYTGSNYPNLNGLDVLPPNSPTDFSHVIAVGNGGSVVKSSIKNGNWVWLEFPVNTNIKLNSVAVFEAFIIAVVGDNGAIFVTYNGGTTWQNKSISPSKSLKKVVKDVHNFGFYTVGTGGAIYTSSNFGQSWQPRNSGTTKTLRDILVSGINSDSAIVVGDDGTVRYTNNGGITWTADPYLNGLTSRDIISIFRLDGTTVNSITRNLSTSDNPAGDTAFFHAVSSEPFIGIEPVSNFIADIFSLNQNYPNPFNPVTNIEITIPKESFVKLVIYDILGKEIETLVNNELKAGTYKIDWNASGYSGGVYFYKIESEGFTATKKMVLIK